MAAPAIGWSIRRFDGEDHDLTERELRDDELQQVSGGNIRIGSIHSTITTIDGPGLLSPGVLKVLVELIVDQLNQPRMG